MLCPPSHTDSYTSEIITFPANLLSHHHVNHPRS